MSVATYYHPGRSHLDCTTRNCQCHLLGHMSWFPWRPVIEPFSTLVAISLTISGLNKGMKQFHSSWSARHQECLEGNLYFVAVLLFSSVQHAYIYLFNIAYPCPSSSNMPSMTPVNNQYISAFHCKKVSWCNLAGHESLLKHTHLNLPMTWSEYSRITSSML